MAGEAGAAYGGRLDSFRRRIVFVKPDLVVIFDSLSAPKPSSFEWRLHAAFPLKLGEHGRVEVAGKRSAAEISFLRPAGLKLSVTDAFDPPPRRPPGLVQWHLTATTPTKTRQATFVTVIRPRRSDVERLGPVLLAEAPGGDLLTAPTARGRAEVLLRLGRGDVPESGLAGRRRVEARVVGGDGRERSSFASAETWRPYY